MGAIAILFIFVIKLLNVRIVELKDNTTRYVPAGLIMGLVLYMGLQESLPCVGAETVSAAAELIAPTYTKISSFTNIELLGLRLFSDLGLGLIVAGYILLLAMVGAIVLTLGHEGEIKRQDIFEQVSRKSEL